MAIECPHKPPCLLHVTRFVCGQRTLTENAVKRGLITREQGLKLLLKYGTVMSPMTATAVYQDKTKGPEQGKLV